MLIDLSSAVTRTTISFAPNSKGMATLAEPLATVASVAPRLPTRTVASVSATVGVTLAWVKSRSTRTT